MLADCGVPMGPSKISRLVREYLHRVEHLGQIGFDEFLVNATKVQAQWYGLVSSRRGSDPTGWTAAHNVDRERE